MPGTMSLERRLMMRAYGANIILTPTMEAALEKLEEFTSKEKVWVPRQYENRTNVDCHKETTGKEILNQLEKVDAFVAGVGTGGTLMGVAEALRAKFSNVQIIAVEPAESPVLSGGKAGVHEIQGIGLGIIPRIVDLNQIDEVVKVKSGDAMDMTRKLARENGLFVGISSGANVAAAMEISKKLPNKNIVTILPDSANRYLSIGLFQA
jgi:cysteine synthase A